MSNPQVLAKLRELLADKFEVDPARIALASGAAIQPILLRCDPPAFTRAGHWYDQPPCGFRLMIEAKPLIGASTLLAEESVDGFKPRALTRALERFFTTELEGYERASA